MAIWDDIFNFDFFYLIIIIIIIEALISRKIDEHPLMRWKPKRVSPKPNANRISSRPCKSRLEVKLLASKYVRCMIQSYPSKQRKYGRFRNRDLPNFCHCGIPVNTNLKVYLNGGGFTCLITLTSNHMT